MVAPIHTKKRILALIPARGGSVGVPRKNIRELNGKPLISYAIDTCLQCFEHADVVVSTDDDEIARVARSFGASIPFKRPSEISGSSATLLLASRHALEFFRNQGIVYDAVISVQPTNPFLRSSTILKAVSLFEEGKFSSVTALAEFTYGHPLVAKRLGDDFLLESFFEIPSGVITHPRQKRERAYYPCGAFYLRASELVLQDECYDGWHLGLLPGGMPVDEREAFDINSQHDFEIAECLMRLRSTYA